jgi:Na+/H+-dicarboxylate symporter
MTFASIDAGALLKMLYWSLIAGVGIAIVFSFAVLGATRSNDMRRLNRTGPATAYAALAAVGTVLSVAIVVAGLVLVGHKS